MQRHSCTAESHKFNKHPPKVSTDLVVPPISVTRAAPTNSADPTTVLTAAPRGARLLRLILTLFLFAPQAI